MTTKNPKRTKVNFISGLLSGSVLAGLFNPWDRALYISVRDQRPFLRKENFSQPFQGFWQAIVQRTISAGLYFFLQGEMRALTSRFFKDNEYHTSKASLHMHQAIVGLSAGTLNGMLLNPISCVKYHAWNNREGLSFYSATKMMLKVGGVKTFFNGIYCTGLRDMIFGLIYELTRVPMTHLYEAAFPRKVKEGDKRIHSSEDSSFAGNMTAGALATIVSAPLNYVRNMKFSTPPDLEPPGTWRCLVDLWKVGMSQNTTIDTLGYFQQRLRLGWGTARVGMGMAVGQYVFDKTRNALENVQNKR